MAGPRPKSNVVRRELAVAFSRRVQPLGLRIGKWIVLIGVAAWLWRTPYFWWWVLAFPCCGLLVHFFYRWKTQGWTRPWGGWDDVDAGGS